MRLVAENQTLSRNVSLIKKKLTNTCDHQYFDNHSAKSNDVTIQGELKTSFLEVKY